MPPKLRKQNTAGQVEEPGLAASRVAESVEEDVDSSQRPPSRQLSVAESQLSNHSQNQRPGTVFQTPAPDAAAEIAQLRADIAELRAQLRNSVAVQEEAVMGATSASKSTSRKIRKGADFGRKNPARLDEPHNSATPGPSSQPRAKASTNENVRRHHIRDGKRPEKRDDRPLPTTEVAGAGDGNPPRDDSGSSSSHDSRPSRRSHGRNTPRREFLPRRAGHSHGRSSPDSGGSDTNHRRYRSRSHHKSKKVDDPDDLDKGDSPTFESWRILILDRLDINADHFPGERNCMN